MDDESWMDEMGWGEDSAAEPEPAVAAAAPIPAAAAMSMPLGGAAASAPAFAPLPGAGQGGDLSQIDLLLDISLQVTVELGRARMKIQEILALRNGSVIELDRLAGEPADILVNGTLIAKGEVVVVDEKFGVRVIEVVSRAKRIASLG
jgi:flagellar motor switch protein FliN/FliY